MNQIRRLLALLAAMALLAAACGDDASDDEDAAASGGDGESAADCGTINFLQPLPASIIFWPLLVGNELGYFSEEGIEVNLLPGGDLPETAFVENGDADIASAGGPEVLQAIDAGSDLVVVYDYWNVAAEGIVTLADGPSSVEEIADGTFGLVTDSDLATVSIVFEELGLDPATADTIVLGESPAILAEALENGEVDAIAGAVFDFIGVQSSGLEIVDITPPGFKASPSASFIVTPDTMANNSDCIGGFLRAWAKGTHAGLHNAENTQAIARAAVPEEWEDEAAGVASYDQSAPAHRAAEADGTYGVVQTDVWQSVADQLVGSGDLDTADIDVTGFVDQSRVEAANDWDRDEVEAEIDSWTADG